MITSTDSSSGKDKRRYVTEEVKELERELRFAEGRLSEAAVVQLMIEHNAYGPW